MSRQLINAITLLVTGFNSHSLYLEVITHREAHTAKTIILIHTPYIGSDCMQIDSHCSKFTTPKTANLNFNGIKNANFSGSSCWLIVRIEKETAVFAAV